MSIEFFARYWKVLFAVLAIVWYFFGLMAYRVQEDARKRGLSKTSVTFWSVSIVFFGPVFLPLYFIFRNKAIFAASEEEKEANKKYTLCPSCGEKNPADRKTCQKCKKSLEGDGVTVGTKSCPYCGAENPVDAERCSACDQVIGFETTDEDGDA